MWSLAVSYLLLPIERGFPVLRVLGYPITLTMIITLVATLVLMMESRGGLLFGTRNPYIIFQVTVVFMLLLSAMVSENFRAGLFVIFNYVSTFILNFLIIDYLFQRGMRRAFVRVIGTVVVLAALVGFIEGALGIFLPFYLDMFLSQNYDQVWYTITRPETRVLGTLGNPLVYGLALILTIGFLAEIRLALVRLVTIGLVAVVSMFTVATTVVLLWLVVTLGAFVTSRHKWRWGILGILLILGGVVAIMLLDLPHSTDFLGPWAVKTDLQTSGYQIRLFLIDWTLEQFRNNNSFLTYAFGFGLTSSIGATYALQLNSLATLDNVYMTLLFESGIFGLGAYCLVAIGLLLRYWKLKKSSLHFYVVLGLLLAGFSFNTIYYATFNLLWVASIAALEDDHRRKTAPKRTLL